MAYNYSNASDLAKWAIEQSNIKTKYRLGGIGRYENGVRIFDCTGLIKCFRWNDYSQYNASQYAKAMPDWNADTMYAYASEKGTIDTIPEIKGLIVYQKDHAGIYIGNGLVVEATASFGGKVVVSHFKGNHNCFKRTSWTHWLKLPQFTYTVASEATIDQLAEDVIAGKYGNGDERKSLLGSLWAKVQARVNELLSSEKKYHTVQKGETLSGIASKYGTTYQALAKLNGLSNPNLIRVGQKIRIK